MLTKEPTVILQPSTRTNNKILKGNATSIGDNIIMPNDIKTEATTISITKKGKKSKNPKYAFAFKMIISEQVGISEVIDIEWNLSKDGYLIPKMKIEPINIAGSIINYATCHHADFVVKNKLNKD